MSQTSSSGVPYGLAARSNKPSWIRDIKSILIKAGLTIAMLLISVTMIVPFLWTISASFKYERDVLSYPPQFIPDEPTLQNYSFMLGLDPERQPRVSLIRAYLNSFLVAVPGVIGPLIVATLAAYAFARMEFPGRDTLFLLYLGTMIVPIQVLIVPRFMLANWFSIYNTHWALLIPYLSEAYAVFLLRQAFLSIPQDLIDAARIDGANHLGVIRHVVVPASASIIAALALLLFIWRWNDYTMPLIMLNRSELYTVPMALAALTEDRVNTQTAPLMAGIVIATAPLVIAFMIANRFFIRSMVHTGLKG